MPAGAIFAIRLFAIAFVPRVLVAILLTGEPVWDGHYYDFGARRIAEGLGYSDDLVVAGEKVWHPWCHYPVGYSAFLGLFYKVFGADRIVAGVVNALVGTLLALVTWRLAARALSPGRAQVAGLLVALHPGLILYSGLVMTEQLAALATLAAFGVATSRRPKWGLTLGALVLGLGALIRPQALLCAPFLAVVVWDDGPAIMRARLVRTAGAAVLGSLLALAPVLPWTVRNCRVMDGCALVSTNAGWNLAIGAFPRATGRFETLRASDGCREVTGQVQQDRCWFSYGVEQIRTRPGFWLSLVPKKLRYTFDHESFAVEYLHEARPQSWTEPIRTQVRDLTTLAHRLLVCAAPFAWIALSKRRWPQVALLGATLLLGYACLSAKEPIFYPFALLAAALAWLPLPGRPGSPPALLLASTFLASTALVHAVFFGEDRYHIVVTPVLCLFAAAALRPTRESAYG